MSKLKIKRENKKVKEKIKCIYCNNNSIIKKGMRKNRLEKLQKYLCKTCNKTFTFKKLKHKTYPANVILNAISYYNLGYSLDKTEDIINKRYKIKISAKTVHNWLNEFKDICTYKRIRDNNLKYNKPSNVIVKKTFRHREQPYKYQYHSSKIYFLKDFPYLKQYLINVKDNCPNNLFDAGKRCSEINLNLELNKRRKFNYACKLAELALKITKDNRKRHQIIQDFMLINDSSTIATEIPVYFEHKNNMMTGHIDILQMRFNKLHVIDYKPGAKKERKATSQVYLYALALSKITKIPLNKFVCAYFDDRDYFEFEPTKFIKVKEGGNEK